MSEWTAATFRDYNAAYASGWGDFTTGWTETFIGKPARTFDAFAEDILVPALR